MFLGDGIENDFDLDAVICHICGVVLFRLGFGVINCPVCLTKIDPYGEGEGATMEEDNNDYDVER